MRLHEVLLGWGVLMVSTAGELYAFYSGFLGPFLLLGIALLQAFTLAFLLQDVKGEPKGVGLFYLVAFATVIILTFLMVLSVGH